jgi:hypothetical protein
MTQVPASSHSYTPPTTREDLFATTAVAAGVNQALDWGFNVGTALLDLTVPALPTIVTAGVYAVTASPFCADGPQAAIIAVMDFQLDLSGAEAPGTSQAFPLGVPAPMPPGGSATLVWFLPAGAEVRCRVKHSAVGALNFTLIANVQRLS